MNTPQFADAAIHHQGEEAGPPLASSPPLSPRRRGRSEESDDSRVLLAVAVDGDVEVYVVEARPSGQARDCLRCTGGTRASVENVMENRLRQRERTAGARIPRPCGAR